VKLPPVLAGKDPRSLALTSAIVVLSLAVLYLVYALVSRHVISPPVDASRPDGAGGEVIQVDVLNGCGIPGAATGVTSYLRNRGFDVVEVRNYRTFDVDESLVVTRRGSLEAARRVAYALGIRTKNIVQQINEDYYVDVSVVIGKDYRSLKSSQQGDSR